MKYNIPNQCIIHYTSQVIYHWPAAISNCYRDSEDLNMVLYVLMDQQVDHDHTLYSAMKNAASMGDGLNELGRVVGRVVGRRREPTNLDTLLLAIRGRHSSNPIDKICAIAFPFQKRGSHNFHNVTFPIYDPNTPISVAWERLISSIASAKMDSHDLVDHGLKFYHTTTIQLLCLFPHPSRHHWFPSWTQVQQYPDVSVRDNDPVPVTGEMDYSLRIMSGRIYRGCSLRLKQRPTRQRKAIYYCFMDHKLVELVATVPGVEFNIDSKSTYVLVDISSDYSLWPDTCIRSWVGHAHPPLWSESVIIVCKEIDNLAQPVQITTSSPAILRYRLRRITTLLWDCKLPNWQPTAIKRWLPFRPSLEHMRSVVYNAEASKEGPHSVTSLCLLDVFCDPAAVAGLPIKNGRREWDKCPVYEVYLV